MDHTNAAAAAAAAVAAQGFCAAASDADAVTATTSCVPCASLDPSHLLPVEVIRDRIQHELSPWWSLRTGVVERGEEEEEEGDTNNVTIKIESMLYRKFTTKHFQAALDAINAMGRIAETQNHHPNFHLTNYREVTIEIYTHKIGGVSDNDMTLARLFDEQVTIDYSPKWLREQQEKNCSSSPKKVISDPTILRQ
jgi:pterin-4a-carbinolamine dehydratase